VKRYYNCNSNVTLQIQPEYSLDHVEQLPEIPTDAVYMEFEIQREDNDSDVTNNFLQDYYNQSLMKIKAVFL
jgi:hypothetical protein